MSGTSNLIAAAIDNEMSDLKAINAIIAKLTGMSGRWQEFFICMVYTITKNGLLFTQMIQPRIRPIMIDCYKDKYFLDEERYAKAKSHNCGRRFCSETVYSSLGILD
ncbi:uncharacterized protein MELLADRAFT_112945 [Melampsora larici-populina 98AG31]|uniref:Uncharacterized protein n=1 Tax=Melampsora larici-populina (strain 98AG31 / pathotype 3-4-7) TaxID=747676 RepID=F4S871_MELLP|nr:uncharacterized protein MELLADRAFT_112945 [Melampsora larici-populina 98AG31]EGF99167.1 hypothetical protein MELLADRAFT_112945 [Melampsora larici-populina 98AG31]